MLTTAQTQRSDTEQEETQFRLLTQTGSDSPHTGRKCLLWTEGQVMGTEMEQDGDWRWDTMAWACIGAMGNCNPSPPQDLKGTRGRKTGQGGDELLFTPLPKFTGPTSDPHLEHALTSILFSVPATCSGVSLLL
ncbi:hypothetical protein SKAU_G00377130 [Synaphobranchus kaupii]|uniref:Uncharacterized protein n=1 Tax=Synaphobranchus kaupii TaxID=118154 RepID=A0A9Q1ICA0_SYNKA|nr:hypothetical protein SKAU_G00377130 [Synaphobranchus kaupii]